MGPRPDRDLAARPKSSGLTDPEMATISAEPMVSEIVMTPTRVSLVWGGLELFHATL